ncbi:hypothetical protein E3O11_11290 [Cryobacterium levicorallinum]|uniref:Uncharacterized protein n=2 Tax=Cryobacterium levicorallinum TaxID=995038 RepID=A0A4R8VK90_9MICO|nr:hypothetical protein E3O11_11290 [Cryobacterium levicorallinum]
MRRNGNDGIGTPEALKYGFREDWSRRITMEIDWVNLVPIVAIISGIVYAIFDQFFKTRRRLAEAEGTSALRKALTQSNQTNTALLKKLTAMDSRLGAIERTLSAVG